MRLPATAGRSSAAGRAEPAGPAAGKAVRRAPGAAVRRLVAVQAGRMEPAARLARTAGAGRREAAGRKVAAGAGWVDRGRGQAVRRREAWDRLGRAGRAGAQARMALPDGSGSRRTCWAWGWSAGSRRRG